MPANQQWVPEFLKAIQTLQLNQISQPVKSQYGYHIIQVFELRSSAAGQAVTIEDELKKDPGSFAKVAARESVDHATADKGGDIGWVAPYEKSQSLEKAIFSLTKVGQISAAATDTDGSMYIFKLLETSPYRYVAADRLSTIASTGFPQWRDTLKTEIGYWIDPQYASTATSPG